MTDSSVENGSGAVYSVFALGDSFACFAVRVFKAFDRKGREEFPQSPQRTKNNECCENCSTSPEDSKCNICRSRMLNSNEHRVTVG
jgi:hypothetical protein